MFHELRENGLACVHPSLSVIDAVDPAALGSRFSLEKVQIEKSKNPG
jgi:hypothetical protein